MLDGYEYDKKTPKQTPLLSHNPAISLQAS